MRIENRTFSEVILNVIKKKKNVIAMSILSRIMLKIKEKSKFMTSVARKEPLKRLENQLFSSRVTFHSRAPTTYTPQLIRIAGERNRRKPHIPYMNNN